MIEKVNILGREYRVEFKKIPDADGVSQYGRNDLNKGIIRVNPKSPNVDSTLVHEVLHGIFHESGLSHLFTSDTEEAIVVAVENGLVTAGLIPRLSK